MLCPRGTQSLPLVLLKNKHKTVTSGRLTHEGGRRHCREKREAWKAILEMPAHRRRLRHPMDESPWHWLGAVEEVPDRKRRHSRRHHGGLRTDERWATRDGDLKSFSALRVLGKSRTSSQQLANKSHYAQVYHHTYARKNPSTSSTRLTSFSPAIPLSVRVRPSSSAAPGPWNRQTQRLFFKPSYSDLIVFEKEKLPYY